MNIVSPPDDDLGPTTRFLLDEVRRRGIPFRRFGNSSLLMLGYGCRQKKIRTAVTERTSGLGMEIASDKEETKQLLLSNGLPIPRGYIVYDEEELQKAFSKMRPPVVIKPLNGNHGRGVTTNITSIQKAAFAFELAKRISNDVIIEEYVQGDDYRFLVVNFKLVAVAKRTPAHVIGDGKLTIRQLVDQENRNSDRGDTDFHVLAPIRIDDATREILLDKNLTLDSVLPEGQVLHLKTAANISAGGTSTDVTEQVHPENAFLAERVARIFNLDICGVDIMATRIDTPLSEGTGAIIEVNAGPGLRMHSDPTYGTKRNVAVPIIDMLFPDKIYRIPVVAVCGQQRDTTVRLLSKMTELAGFHTGFMTDEGVFIREHPVNHLHEETNQSFHHAQLVLFDPTVNFAVLACPGKMKHPAFDRCDIAVLAGKDENNWDHIAKQIVHHILPGGYLIVDADDDAAFALSGETDAPRAFFSISADNERLKAHCENGGLGAIVENCFLTVCHGRSKVRMEELGKIPFCEGKNERVKFVLPALLAAFIREIPAEDIRRAIRTFVL